MFVNEESLDYDAIFERGGRNLGDEDFALFKCPNCNQIFLLEYEVDTVYLDPNDLSQRLPINYGVEPFECTNCSFEFDPSEPWISDEALEKYKVRWSELEKSQWNWIVGNP